MHDIDEQSVGRVTDVLRDLDALTYIEPSQEPYVRSAVRSSLESIGFESTDVLDDVHGEMLLFVSQEELRDKLKKAWAKIDKTWTKTAESTEKAFNWFTTDGKGLISITKNKFNALKEKRASLSDVEVSASDAILIKEGAAIKPLWDDLVDDLYEAYADDKAELGKVIRRLRPGGALGTSVASFKTQDVNQNINALDEKIDEIRKEINRVKAKARDAGDTPVRVSSLLRDLDTLSTWNEDISDFVEKVNKDTKKWHEDSEKMERVLESDNTEVKGAEEFIRLVGLNYSDKLLRLCNTLIKHTSSNISKAHRQLTVQ